MLKKLILGLLLPLVPAMGFAWGITGHRIVGELASRHLTPKAAKAVKAILGNESMAMVANWPDFIKSDTTRKYGHTNSWHYLDFPTGNTRAQFDEFLAAHNKGENLYVETQELIKELKDPATSAQEKKFALTFLIHLIGDMHQPLHTGREEDQGGNKIQVTYFDKPSNLHHVWDEQLIEGQQLSYTEYTQALDTASVSQVKEIQSGNIADWMYESNKLADDIYARTPADSKLSYRYNYIFIGTVNNQLMKGGLRLAGLLNEIFK
jgi:hypothetical protein